jgi:hypothetical protein
LILIFFYLVDTDRFSEAIYSFKNLERMRINELLDCQDSDEYMENGSINLRIKGFQEIKRDQLEFFKKFINSSEESNYVILFLNEITKEAKTEKVIFVFNI